MNENLITKYRPQIFADVIGQDAVVRSLIGICRRKDTQVFLFSGPSGCGKTTLARIVAREYGVEDKSVMELDAASRTGVDDMRQLQEILQYRPFGDSGKRALILDECHALSKQAFDSLLKSLEDPPAHIVWCFCTTNPSKIPKTLQTRCTKFDLKEVSDKDLGDLLDFVCTEEVISLDTGIEDLVIREARGSPRQLLSNLVVVQASKNRKEAAQLLRTVIETDASLALCQYIVNGAGSWSTCMSLIDKLGDSNPESIRILVVNYLAACLKNAKSNDQAGAFLEKLDAFSQPYEGSAGMAPLFMSIGRSIFVD